MKLISIMWSEPKPPNHLCSYDHILGKHPLGEFSIEWKSWKEYDHYTCYLNEDYINDEYSLDEAKDICQIHINSLILKCLEI